MKTHTKWQEETSKAVEAEASQKSGSLHSFQFTIEKKNSDKAKNIYGWIEQIVFGDKAFDTCEDQLELKYSKLEKISKITILKYLEGLSEVVQERLKNILPSKIWLKFDSWIHSDEHYTCIFASWTDKFEKVKEYLLSCGPQDIIQDEKKSEDEEEDEDDSDYETVVGDEKNIDLEFKAEDYGDYILDELASVGKTLDDVLGFSGDNAAVNKKLARISFKKFIGCRAHRLHLAVKRLYDRGIYKKPVDKVHSLMIALRTLKNAARLKKRAKKKAIIRNQTRWSSTFNMLRRYREIRTQIFSLWKTSSSSSESSTSSKRRKRSNGKVSKKSTKRNRIFKSKYVPLKHLTSTVCVCERLFSRTKIIMRPQRASMQPWHLELLVFLRVNKSLWGIDTIEELMRRNYEESSVITVADEE